MSAWWWFPLGVGACGAAALRALAARLRSEAAALDAASRRLRRSVPPGPIPQDEK